MSATPVVTSDVVPPRRGTFRTCPATGRQIEIGAERLIKVQRRAFDRRAARRRDRRACCSCSPGGRRCTCCRPIWYYRILGVHGMSMLIFFIIFFEMAVLYFASTVLLNARSCGAEDVWFAFALDARRRADGRVR